MIHKLKTWPMQFAAVIAGAKTAEYRKDDREFVIGDVLHLREWTPEHETYTGCSCMVAVTHIVRAGHFGVPKGFCVLSIRLTSKDYIPNP